MRGWQPPCYTTPPPLADQGLWVPGSRPQRRGWGLGVSSQGHKEQRCEERRQRQDAGREERRRTRALVRVRAADKPGRWYRCGRQTKPAAVRGTAGAALIRGLAGGGGGQRPAGRYLNISLCHTRGAADNFITSADKNDCGRMQMAPVSLPATSAPPPAAGGAQRRARAPRPAPDPPPHSAPGPAQLTLGPAGPWV